MILYLATTEHAISSVLLREERTQMKLVYYVSKRLLGAESRYPIMERLALCLVHASRKLRPYFQAHPIRVFTNHPLRQVLAKPETSGRLLKWAIELGQFEITYHPRTTIKGQALADFIVECTGLDETPSEVAPREVWKLYVDCSETNTVLGAGIILITPTGYKFHTAL